MTQKVSVAHNQGWLLLSAIFGMFSTLAMTVIVGRTASLETFGLFALIGALMSFTRDVSDLGTSAVATRDAARDQTQEPTILSRLLAWRLCICCIVALGCLFLAYQRGWDVEGALIALSAGVILTTYNNGLIAVFQLRQLQHIPAILNIAANAAALAAIGVILVTHAPALLAALVIILREGIIIITNRWLAIQHLDQRPAPLAALRNAWHWAPSTLGIYALAALCWQILLNSGTFIVELSMSGEALGTYMSAFRLATPLFGIGWLLTAPLMAVFSIAWKHDQAAFERQTQTALGLAIGTGALLAAIGAQLSLELIQLIYGSALEDDIAKTAAKVLQWFMLAFAGSLMIAVVAPAMLAQGRERALTKLSAGAMSVSVISAVLAAQADDMTLIAAALALGMSGCSLIAALALGGMPWRSLGLVVVPALSAVGLLSLVPQELPAIWHVGAGGSITLIGLCLLWLRPNLTDYRREQDALAAMVLEPPRIRENNDA